MARVKAHDAYKKYLELGKEDLQLPNYVPNSNSSINPFVGEVYCRAEGCDVDTRFFNLNNLKKHIRRKHSTNYNLVDGEDGGRPSRQAENEAIAFYQGIINAYNARIDARGPILPPLPRRRDGKIRITEMRKAVRSMGHAVPCNACKANVQAKICCHAGVKGTCDNFKLFDVGEDFSKDIAAVIDKAEEQAGEQA